MDAGAFGCRLGPKDAYRFAKGEEITASSGQQVKLSRPLDFLVVDRSLGRLGILSALLAGDPELLATRKGRKWYDMIQSGKGAEAAIEIIISFGKGQMPKGYSAARHAGLSLGLAGDDQGGGRGERSGPLHRLHRLRVDLEHRRQQPAPQRHLPRQRRQGQPGRALHHAEAARQRQSRATCGNGWPLYEEKTGGEVLAIAHNGNLSNGRMFPIIESFTGKKIDREYAENRVRSGSALYEATQIKGDGETHPFLSPNDEFANFERWDKGNLDLSELKKPEMLEFEYARSALKNGLKLEKELGVNPYKFGLVGITDAHTGLAAVEEDNFFGKTSASEPSATRATHPFVKTDKAVIMGWETDRLRLCRRVGAGEHARGHLRRDEAPRNLCHHRPAHGRALLRRLRFRGGGRATTACPRRSATPRACRWAAT